MTATIQMVLAHKVSKAAANHNAEEKSKVKSMAALISIGQATENNLMKETETWKKF
jgi:hypothetical protein